MTTTKRKRGNMNLDFQQTLDRLKDVGFNPNPEHEQIAIPQAREVLWKGIKYFTGETAKWLPEYEKIAEWLTDNKGRGLLCVGNCGRGKTVICGKILPILLHCYKKKILSMYDAIQMNKEFEEMKKKRLVMIDDLGIESEAVDYGERRMVFPELADIAEKQGNFLVVTTNLSLDELTEKYGERTIDRLRSITKVVFFKGKSLRK